jgi:hypothetical protein
MIASATANSGARASSSRAYSPIQKALTARAVSWPVRSMTKRRNSSASAAYVWSALKLSITTKPGRRSRRIARIWSSTAFRPLRWRVGPRSS